MGFGVELGRTSIVLLSSSCSVFHLKLDGPAWRIQIRLASLGFVERLQYIPKKRRMETLTDEELTMIENRLNHRPRKRLGFKTPHEVFHASLNRVAPRT